MDAVILALLGFAGTNEDMWRDVRPDDDVPTRIVLRVGIVSTRLQGVAIWALVQNGMPRSWVRTLFWNRSCARVAFETGSGVTEFEVYTRLGLSVTYFNDRVRNIRIHTGPLFCED